MGNQALEKMPKHNKIEEKNHTQKEPHATDAI